MSHDFLLRLVNIPRNAAWFWAHALWIFCINAYFGWGLLVLALPRWFSFRWITFAPIVGIALTAVLITPSVYLLCPIATVTIPFLVVVTLINLIALRILIRRLRPARIGRRLTTYAARHGLLLGWSSMTLALLSASLITNGGRGSATDVWGSGDIATYGVNADYLQRHRGSSREYDSQHDYLCDTVAANMKTWARLGSMADLSLIARLCGHADSYVDVNPYIISMMMLYLLIGRAILDRQKISSSWPILVLLCSPFLFFLLEFSYLGQSMGIPVVVAAAWMTWSIFRPEEPRRAATSQALAAGLLLAGAILIYPMTLPAVAIFATLLTCWLIRGKATRAQWKRVSVCFGVAILGCSFYLPRIFHELKLASQMNPAAGWTWKGLIGMEEVLGLRSVLGYDLPAVGIRARWLDEGLLTLASTALALIGFRTLRDKPVWLALIATTFVTVCLALRRVLEGVQNANHGYVKAISQFCVLLLLLPLIPLAKRFQKQQNAGLIALAGFTLFAWIRLELHAVRHGVQAAWCDAATIALIRQQSSGGKKIFVAEEHWDDAVAEMAMHDSSRLFRREPSGLLQPNNCLTKAGWPYPAAFFARQSRTKTTGRPPAEIDLPPRDGAAWILPGFDGELSDVTGRSRCVAFMGPPSGDLEVVYDLQIDPRNTAICEMSLNERRCEEQPLRAGCNQVLFRIPRGAWRDDDPYCLVSIKLNVFRSTGNPSQGQKFSLTLRRLKFRSPVDCSPSASNRN